MKGEKSFFDKIRFKYKIYVLNENTLEEAFHFRISQLSIFLFAGFFALISFTIIALIIFFTPLKHFLPGYADASAREELISEAIRVDSISIAMEQQMKQLNMIKHIINGTLPMDTFNTADSVTLASWADLPLERTPEESTFAKKFEEESKYNLQILNDMPKAETSDRRLFIRPINGTIVSKYNPKINKYGIEIYSQPREAIMSIAKGRIISVSNEEEEGYSVVIQHENGYLSIYKHINAILKSNNDEIMTGDVIGINDAADTDDNKTSKLYFELWRNGNPLNPEEYIMF